ncbi:PA0069 family radical SAM protein [Variovorax sp. PCZ-1]|nr:PA0069 family radical SAM protein [Variovorax sp. PCZ-1]
MPVPETLIPLSALKGRGAVSKITHRFNQDERAQFDDGWDTLDLGAMEAASLLPPATQVRIEEARTAINKNDSPDIYFDYSVNPYRGCEHGCIYCYARPTHSYLNLSPGLDFETQIIAKSNIAQVLRAELSRKHYIPQLINIGSATDCYQPAERELKLTRSVIELMAEVGHPMSLVTKSSGVERDLDLLVPMAQRKLVAVYVTITTMDAKLARILEPRAAAPHRRLQVIRKLASVGVPVGVSVAPQIPFINEDMEQVLEAAWDAGARTAFYTVIRLPWEISPLFRQWLSSHYPQRAERVMARVQEMRGGMDYDANFATRMKGQGIWAELIKKRFETACRKHGFNREGVQLDLSQFVPPSPDARQTALF